MILNTVLLEIFTPDSPNVLTASLELSINPICFIYSINLFVLTDFVYTKFNFSPNVLWSQFEFKQKNFLTTINNFTLLFCIANHLTCFHFTFYIYCIFFFCMSITTKSLSNSFNNSSKFIKTSYYLYKYIILLLYIQLTWGRTILLYILSSLISLYFLSIL